MGAHQQPFNTQPNSVKSKSNRKIMPISIIFSFGLIAVAILFQGNSFSQVLTKTNINNTQTITSQNTSTIAPINKNDHIRGNPNAPIVIVEYSDFDCPFCKKFHETMKQIMDIYGTDGSVAWVIRNFPINKIHPNASYLAEASECVSSLGGNEAFWKFSDLIFGERSGNELTDTTRLNEFVVISGVNKNDFKSCMTNGKMKQLVEEDVREGTRAGAKGTPYSIILFSETQFIVDGAQPYGYISNILDTMIGKKNN